MKKNFVHYNNIINIISKLDRRKLAEELIGQIRKVENRPEGSVPEPPFIWNLLFLLKLASEHGTFGSSIRLNKELLQKLHSECVELGNYLAPEITNDAQGKVVASRIIRSCAHQQFWLLGNLNFVELGRSLLIAKEYTRLGGPHYGPENVSFDSFIRMLLIIYIWKMSHKSLLTFPISDPAVVIENKEEYRKVIDFITLNISDYNAKFKSAFSIQNPIYQISEPSVFYKYPIISIFGNYYLVSQSVLRKTISYYIFEKLSRTSVTSRNTLAKAFENYIFRLSKEVSNSVKLENEIRSKLNIKKNESCVDVWIEGEDVEVVIECKALISQAMARAVPAKKISISTYRDTIVKAFAQCINFADRFLKSDDSTLFLIITLDELYLPNTLTLFLDFLEEGLKEHYPAVNVNAVSKERIFVISISDYEIIVGMAAEREISIGKLLKNLVSGKNDYIMFSEMYKDLLRPGFKIPIISNESEEVFDSIIKEAEVVLSKRSQN